MAGAAFENVRISVPFFNRGYISSYNARPSVGTVAVARQSHQLVWRLDKHFHGKQSSASLSADLVFDVTQKHMVSDDSFCHGLNAYADVEWTAPGKTLSNTAVACELLKIHPPLGKSKLKANFSMTLKSGFYRIWNTNGATRQRTVCTGLSS